MDRQSIIKFFNDNTQNANQTNTGEGMQILNHGNIVVQYGDNATFNSGCSINNNDNLTCEDKRELKEMIKTMEARNRKQDEKE